MTSPRPWFVLGLITVGLAAIVSNVVSLQGDFVWDDRWLVLESPITNDGEHWLRAFVNDYFQGADPRLRYGYYRPLSALSLVATHELLGAEPFAFHLTNLVLHLTVSLLLCWLAIRLGGTRPTAIIAGLLFAAHPIHVESVAWISGRTDLLATVFGLASLVLLIHARDSESWKKMLLLISGWVVFLCALLSKEAVAFLPLCLLVYGRADPEKQESWRAHLPNLIVHVALLTGYVLFRLAFVALPDAELDGAAAPLTKLFSALAGMARYLLMFLAPLVQRPYMQVPMSLSPFEPMSLFGVVLLTGLVLAWRRRSGEGISRLLAALLCFALCLLPVLNFVRITSPSDMGFTMAERFLYLPSLFAALAIAELSSMGAQRFGRRGRTALIALGMSCLCGMLWVSHHRALTWKDELTLFGTMTRGAPRAPLPAVLLSQALRRDGRNDDALHEVERALRLYDALEDAPPPALSVTVAGIRLSEGRLDEAARLLEHPSVQALGAAAVHRDLATIHRLQGRLDEAEAQLDRALEIEPNNPLTWHHRTLLHLHRGDTSAARAAVERARRRSPRDPALLHASALVARAEGDLERAETELSRSIERGNETGRVFVDLGVLLSESERHDESITRLRRAIDVEPTSFLAHHALTIALLRAQRFDEALEQLEEMTGRWPNDERIHRLTLRARAARERRENANE